MILNFFFDISSQTFFSETFFLYTKKRNKKENFKVLLYQANEEILTCCQFSFASAKFCYDGKPTISNSKAESTFSIVSCRELSSMNGHFPGF